MRSVTFSKACGHIVNFTSGHETRWGQAGDERIEYPDNHIEADNRLSWILGRLEQRYADDAYYVHLLRDPEETAKSFARRIEANTSIIAAYRQSILCDVSAAL